MSVQLSRGRSLPLTSISSSQLNKTSSLPSGQLRGKKIEVQKLGEGNSAPCKVAERVIGAGIAATPCKVAERVIGAEIAATPCAERVSDVAATVEVFGNRDIMEVMHQFLDVRDITAVTQITREVQSSVKTMVDDILNDLESGHALPIEAQQALQPGQRSFFRWVELDVPEVYESSERLEFILDHLCECAGEDPDQIQFTIEYARDIALKAFQAMDIR